VRTIVLFNIVLIFLIGTAAAQTNPVIIVKAGTKVMDYFPLNERYLYPEFVNGNVYFLNGSMSESKVNYNILYGEIEFLDSRGDTLVFINKDNIKYVKVGDDVFYYDKVFFQMISNEKSIIVAQRHYIEYLGSEKIGAYGMSSSTSSIDSYRAYEMGGTFYKLTVAEDTKFRETTEYYISLNGKEFFPFLKRNVNKLFPEHKKSIKSFMKASDIDLGEKEDLLILADYLGNF